MPIKKVSGGYQWGNHGHVYPNREGAEKQAAAAHANGYIGKSTDLFKGWADAFSKFMNRKRPTQKITWNTEKTPMPADDPRTFNRAVNSARDRMYRERDAMRPKTLTKGGPASGRRLFQQTKDWFEKPLGDDLKLK